MGREYLRQWGDLGSLVRVGGAGAMMFWVWCHLTCAADRGCNGLGMLMLRVPFLRRAFWRLLRLRSLRRVGTGLVLAWSLGLTGDRLSR